MPESFKTPTNFTSNYLMVLIIQCMKPISCSSFHLCNNYEMFRYPFEDHTNAPTSLVPTNTHYNHKFLTSIQSEKAIKKCFEADTTDINTKLTTTAEFS